MILLPLRPAFLTHKNRQRRKIIHDMRSVGRQDRIDQSENVFVEYPSSYPLRVISVTVV